jgi:hypothetical protein
MDALNETLWDWGNGGYYRRHYICRDRTTPGCGGGATWAFDPEKHSVSQAWAQRAQALLATSIIRSVSP